MKRTNVKPTPGPWRSWPREEGSLITNSDGTEAVCHLVITPREPGKRYPALTDANARLITAAPELLDALRSALPLAEKGYAWWQTRYEANPADEASGHLDGLLATIEAVRAAIVKAEGHTGNHAELERQRREGVGVFNPAFASD